MKKSKTVLVMRKGRPVGIERAVWDYNRRRRFERKLEREKRKEAQKNEES